MNITQVGFTGNVNTHTVIKALACRAGFATSAVSTYTYDVKTATPTIAVAAGTYNNDTLPGLAGGADFICYETVNANPAPACAGTVTNWTGCAGTAVSNGATAANITADNTTLRAVACTDGRLESDPITPQVYNLQVAPITFHCTTGGCVAPVGPTDSQTVYSSTDANPGMTIATATTATGTNHVFIRYTKDGTAPTACALAVGGMGDTTTEVDGVTTGTTIANGGTLRAIGCKSFITPAPDAPVYLTSLEHSATFADPTTTTSFSLKAGSDNNPDPLLNTNTILGSATGSRTYYVEKADVLPTGAVVCYTLDGAAPDCDGAGGCGVGAALGAPLTINAAATGADGLTTLQARSCKLTGAGEIKSAIQTNVYRLQVSDVSNNRSTATTWSINTVATFENSADILSAPTGAVAEARHTTDGVTYRSIKTTDGTTPADPTCATGVVGATVTLTANPTRVKVIGCSTAAGYTGSAISSYTYTVGGIGAPVLVEPNVQGDTVTGPTFAPLNIRNFTQTLTISDPSGVGGSVICAAYTAGNGTPVQASCNGAFNGCTTGTLYAGAIGPVVSIANPISSIDAVVCAPGVGQSAHTSRQLIARPSDAALTVAGGTPNVGGLYTDATLDLSVNPTAFAVGVTLTQSPATTYCWTTNGSSPDFGPLASGVATACTAQSTATTCGVKAVFDAAFNAGNNLDTTGLRVASCVADYLPGVTLATTYPFVEYARTINASGSNYANGENRMATSGSGDFLVSWDATNIYTALTDPELAADGVTTNTQNFYFRRGDGGATTTAKDHLHDAVGAAGALPVAVSHHIACANGALNTTTCTAWVWDAGTVAWIASGMSYTATRTSLSDRIALTIPRSSLGLNNAGVRSDHLIMVGATTTAGAASVGFPDNGGGLNTDWYDGRMNTALVNPNDATNIN